MTAPLEQISYFTARAQRGDLVVADLPKFDLESYIANYEGQTRIQRLHHIARLSPLLSVEALHLAIPEAKRGRNTDTYISLTTLLHKVSPSDALAVQDTEWIEKRTKENKRETERLEQELKGYKNNLIKESIRMGQEDIATHYLAMADFEDAQRAFQRMREYCTTPKHVAEMTIKLVYASVISSQWIMAQSHCHKARVLTIKPEEKARFDPLVEACSALSYLGVGDYASAAKVFIHINPSYITSDPVASVRFQTHVLSANDIAVYGGLTALASMDRAQLRAEVLDNSSFRTFLELEPHIRRAISSFCEAKYAACLDALGSYRADYQLDVYLSPHMQDLLLRIRAKSIVQYFTPFSHVAMADLAAQFPLAGGHPPTPPAMEAELLDMIASGALDARVDAVEGVLLAPPRDARAEAEAGVLAAAADIERSLRLRLHRTNLSLAGLELSSAGGHKGKGARIMG